MTEDSVDLTVCDRVAACGSVANLAPHPTVRKATSSSTAIFGYVTVGSLEPRHAVQARPEVLCFVRVCTSYCSNALPQLLRLSFQLALAIRQPIDGTSHNPWPESGRITAADRPMEALHLHASTGSSRGRPVHGSPATATAPLAGE